MMKLRKTLSGILFGVGCALAFVGLLALILPAVPNDQLQLVLASFSLPSENALVNVINTCMHFAIGHGWQVLLGGVALLTIGVFFFSRYIEEEAPPPRREIYRRPVQQPEPLWDTPEPAHTGPNPFADLALWDQYAPKSQASPAREVPTVGFVSPMLEPNRIEQEPPAPIPDSNYARPAPQPAPPPPQPETEPIAAPVFTPPAETEPLRPALPVQPAAEPAESAAPAPGAPVQLSPRIRSTMGKHRET